MAASDTQPAGLEIRSFHVVFRIERRIHRIDRWRLPFPHGVPVMAVGHAAAALLAIIALGRLPGLGAAIAALPAPVAYVVAPAAAAVLLGRLRIDGRPAHSHLLARLAACRGRRAAGGRPAPEHALHIAAAGLAAHAAGRSPWLHARIHGPATVTVALPARARARARKLTLTPAAGPPLARRRAIRLAPGQTLETRPR